MGSTRRQHAAMEEENTIKEPVVADHDGMLLGFAELESDGHICAFYCHHEWQRQGVGRALFEALEKEALHLHIRTLQVDSSAVAKLFFHSMGFEVVDVQEAQAWGTQFKNFTMTKRLDAPQWG